MPQSKCKETFRKADKQVYVLIRFKEEVKERVRTACFLEKRVIENYNGRVIGLSKNVTMYEGHRWPGDYAVLLLMFPTEAEAERWLQSDRKFSSKEWPLPSCSLEIMILPMTYIPPNNALTFQLLELHDFMDAEFQNKYVDKVAPIMDTFKVKHGVVATYDVKGNRDGWISNKTYCILNAYDSPHDVDTFYYSDQYSKFKDYRQSACTTENIVFELDPYLTPPKK